LFALAREQPKHDAIMVISSDGAVNPSELYPHAELGELRSAGARHELDRIGSFPPARSAPTAVPDGHIELDATSQLRVERYALRHPGVDLTHQRTKEARRSRVRREHDIVVHAAGGLSHEKPLVAAQAHSGVQLIPLKHDEFGDPNDGWHVEWPNDDDDDGVVMESSDITTADAAAHPSEPNLHATSHTGAGVFVLSDLGWLAGLDSSNRWQDFGGHKEGSESPWQTAAREFEEEAGISANLLVSLAPPYRMVKNEHIYVIHVAKLLPGAPPLRTNNEILAHKHFTGFLNKFADEIVAPSIVHRRVLDPEFLAIVCKIHTDLLKPARQRVVARYSAGHKSRALPAATSAVVNDSLPKRAASSRTKSHADENESANVGTSSAIQLSVTDAIASVTLASRVDRGDPESCDDVGDDIPQGNARHNRNPNSLPFPLSSQPLDPNTNTL
jgi:8-oxo-dGTP pyrophosphatase MutT (NUDIX family)